MAESDSGFWRKIRAAIAPGPVGKDEAVDAITIVSGLPRSGTSMMMKMLEAGGIPPLTDKIRTPDEDNPKGYYEFERVKKLSDGDAAWLKDAQGRAVKVIAALLQHLPADYDYKVVFMLREMDEVLRSQREMLVRRNEASDKVSDEELAALFQKHLDSVRDWMAEQPNVDVLYVNYNEVVANPGQQAMQLDRFFGITLDVEKMASVVDPDLYRQRQ